MGALQGWNPDPKASSAVAPQTDPSAPHSDEIGLSLTELSETYVALLGGGNDPYTPVPQPRDPLGRSIADLIAEPSLESTDVAESILSDDLEITPRGILEAMLFVGHPDNRPLESAKIASLMRGVTAGEIDECVLELNQIYGERGAPYVVESSGAGYRLVLREEFSPLAHKFLGRAREARLAQSAIDVLAIVAYNEPVSRSEVDRLRGQASGAVLAQLVRRDMLRVERPGGDRRTLNYSTTGRFLDLFGLDSIDDLPRSHDQDRTL